MPQAKVKFGLINYTRKDEATGRDYEDRAFRDMIVEIRQDEYDRLLEQGAIVAPDVDLPRPGRLSALPETASDEEILNWAQAATHDEIREECRTRPILAERLTAAWEAVQERVKEYREHMSGALDAANDGADEADAAALEAQRAGTSSTAVHEGAPHGTIEPTPGGSGATSVSTVPGGVATALASTPGSVGPDGGPAPSGTVPGPEGTGEAADAERFDEIVKQNRDAVLKHISENPADAAAILEAENRRAALENEQPRVSVIRAVEAAAGHAGT
jgi:hypothetical protein